MSIDSRLQRVEQTLAGTASMSRLASGPRITIPAAAGRYFNEFAREHGVDQRAFLDFKQSLAALEAQKIGATK